MKRCVPEYDIATRYGGDEFLIILPRTHLAGSLAAAEHVWRTIGAFDFDRGNGVSAKLTASIGISFYPNKNVAGPEQSIAHADEVPYKSKHDGRKMICIYQHYNYFYQTLIEDE